MKQVTNISRTIEGTEYMAKYDAAAKSLLSDKQVLARIVKGTTEEFKNYSIEEIIKCIEGEPEVAVHEVFPGAIHGMNTESAIPGEGKVFYDIYFYVLSREAVPIKIIINIELQKKYYMGYHFGSRGVFYTARMISEQLDKEFGAENYDDLKKVYSIWICMDAPEKDANTITECSMEQKELYGNFQGKEKCDYLSVIIIRLSGKEAADQKNELIHMLTVLLSEKLDAETKKQELETKHGIIMTKKIEGGIRSMCNLGEGLAEKYEAIGMARGEAIGMARGEAIGMVRGEARGEQKGLVETFQELGKNIEDAIEKLIEKFELNKEQAEEIVKEYWKA